MHAHQAQMCRQKHLTHLQLRRGLECQEKAKGIRASVGERTRMGHSNVPLTFTYSCSNREKHKSSHLQPYTSNENLNNALGAIRVLGLERIEDELKPHLRTVLVAIQEKNKGAAEQVVISGILPILALLLRDRGPLALLTAQLVAELAKESVIRKGFGDAGLVTALLSVLTCADQNLLRLAVQAIARVSYDSCKHQQLLLRRGAIPRLVAVLLRFPCNEALEEVCLRALCNLSGMSVTEEAGMVWERGTPAQPGECIFCGVSPRKCGFVTSVTVYWETFQDDNQEQPETLQPENAGLSHLPLIVKCYLLCIFT
ncbi:rap1 GTPase-GDP dissociation stimulator 1 isoform X2 [Corythoichthys intestinalis]|uniref:rap1 GTPase-GDP dissociation stimulator 1 isoform X2 n=1 Tax=Corythoichthys intestinalis TaxID=161448 RepID=UPI0025A55AD1|nr:rap1 GTPase-GDP dissociation stimulator 1 isoform X2 [Corythoichthys intestinalis]